MSSKDQVIPDSQKYRNEKSLKDQQISFQLISETSIDEKLASTIKNEEEKIAVVLQLRSIHLGWNRISRIEHLEPFTKLNVLYLQHNLIERIEGLQCLINLQYLALNGNKIRVIQGLKGLKSLEGLNLNQNLIEQVEPRQLPMNLQLLSFKGNPCTVNSDYRIAILKALKHLEMLDDQEITPEERFKTVGRFPSHLLGYAAQMKQYRTKQTILAQNVIDAKPILLGDVADQRQAVAEIRAKTNEFITRNQNTFTTQLDAQKEDFNERIGVAKKIRSIKEREEKDRTERIQRIVEERFKEIEFSFEKERLRLEQPPKE